MGYQNQSRNFSSVVSLAGLALLVGAAAGGDCGAWTEVSVPSFGVVRDIVFDVDAKAGPVHLLMGSKDNLIVNGDQHFHVLRREGNAWIDLGEPDVSAIEAVSFGHEGVIWSAIAVGPEGSVWIGGEHEPLAQVNRGYQRPVFAHWSPGSGWSEPVSVVLATVTVEPFSPRGGSVLDMAVAPDGTVFASGLSGGWGGLSENNGSIPMLIRHDASGWQEINVPDRDWPGVRGVTDANGVVAFAADEILTAGRHPGGNGVGSGALIVSYTPSAGDTFVETPAWGGGTNRMVANDIDATAPDNIWVVGEGGLLSETSLLMRFDGSEWSIFPSPFPERNALQDVVVLPNGRAWAFPSTPGTTPGLLAMFDGSQWSAADFLPDTPGSLNAINAAAADADGVVWVGGRVIHDDGEVRAFVALHDACDGCPADLTGDGTLDFFDISAFLNAYTAMNPAADFDGNGVFDFFDVSAFLLAFNAGCP